MQVAMMAEATDDTILRPRHIFMSAACNTSSGCLAWDGPANAQLHSELVAFGAHHWVAIATTQGRIVLSLRGHKGKIQCVAWLKPGQELVSASADGTVRVWQRCHDGKWVCTAVLGGERDVEGPDTARPLPVAQVAVLDGSTIPSSQFQEGSVIAAATATSITIWTRAHCEGRSWLESFRVQVPPTEIASSLSLVPLGGEHVCLWVGGVDNKIHVWSGRVVGEAPTLQWSRAGVLTGHQDWVRAMDWRPLDTGGVMVASGAQDGKVRVWKVEPIEPTKTADFGTGVDGASTAQANGTTTDNPAQLSDNEEGEGDEGLDDVSDFEVRLVIRKANGGVPMAVRLDALLVGHEDWVTGVKWHPPVTHTDGRVEWPTVILSCSMDRSLILWRPEGLHGVWTPVVRLGDIGADIGGAIGGNLLGFMGCVFGEGGRVIMAHGFGGSLHAYERVSSSSSSDDQQQQQPQLGDIEGPWRPRPFSTGHFEEVVDVQWEPAGRYLVSVSKDQTNRLWAKSSSTGTYHEMSRVQVHGYDLTCVEVLPGIDHRLVSGADEKTLRVFDATNKVLSLLSDLAGLESTTPARVETAYVPALGLSNKAAAMEVEGEATAQATRRSLDAEKDDASAIAKARARVTWRNRGPPLEGELVDHTLWPEVRKLYGHGNGVTCLASNHTGTIIASACKARDPQTAAVRLWDTSTWRSAGVLVPGHQSTCVQLAFSHDDTLLVSVSKDRQLLLYARCVEDGGVCAYKAAQAIPRAHKRIIWSCSWSHDDCLLATGSRDGTVRIWRRCGAADVSPVALIQPVTPPPDGEAVSPVTAVAFAPRAAVSKEYVLAVGLESGDVELWIGEGDRWRCGVRYGDELAHSASVKKLRWKPVVASTTDAGDTLEELALASCGADHAVRMTAVEGL